MADCLLVTGGTGLAGSNVALKARHQGRQVRALVRQRACAEPLAAAGVELVLGDVTDPHSLDRALAGVDEVVHTAAVLGGTWSKVTPETFWAVNHDGALAVLDAAARAGVRRTVMIDTLAVLDPTATYTERSAVVPIGPGDSPYVRAKRAACYGALHRAARGQDIRLVTPAAIYGPSACVERSFDPTSFNNTLLRGLTGELKEYVTFPLQWAYAPDVAEICLRALEHGQIGRRYLSIGTEADISSLAAFCNQAAELAGSPHRVKEIDPKAAGGPDIGTMRQFAERVYASPMIDCSATTAALGHAPTPRADALRRTVAWLRDIGKL